MLIRTGWQLRVACWFSSVLPLGWVVVEQARVGDDYTTFFNVSFFR